MSAASQSAGGDGDAGRRRPRGRARWPGRRRRRRATSTSRARGVEAFVAHRAHEALTVGRRPDAGGRRPSTVTHVDRAERGGVGRELVARPRGVGLVRHRDGEPREAQVRASPPPRRRPSPSAPGTPGRPSRGRPPRNAALRIAGERECATGSPMSPVTRVAPSIELVGHHSPRTPWPGDVRLVLRQRGGEVRHAILAGHVEEVGDVGRARARRASDCSVTVMIGVGGSPSTL